MSGSHVAFKVQVGRAGSRRGEVVAVAVTKSEEGKEGPGPALSAVARHADSLAAGAVARVLEEGVFEAGKGETRLLPADGAGWILVVGLGTPDKLDAAAFRRAAAAAMRATRDVRTAETLVSLLASPPLPAGHAGAAAVPSAETRADAVVEGFVIGAYRYDEYKSKGMGEGKRKRRAPPEVVLLAADSREAARLKRRIETAQRVAEGQVLARDLANTPPNVASPAHLASEARRLAKAHGLGCSVLRVPELTRRGMVGILAVGQGSQNPPCLIVLEHKPARLRARPYRRVAVVGKGITFDTGGISIKPAEKMELMKFDKSGACAVLAIVATAARLDLPVHVVGLAACAENMPSGSAYRPGDILSFANGKTVEVLNTDAEGRMVLADALHHAGSFKPDAVVDLATLTGAIDVALGGHYAGLMGNDEGLLAALEAASRNSGERVWRMPIGEEYQEQIKGTHADLSNLGGRSGGALTAGQFLSNFAPAGVPWAHLDIAGTSWSDKDEPERAKGATGFGVRLLSRFLLDLAE